MGNFKQHIFRSTSILTLKLPVELVEVVDVEIDETRVPAGPLELGSEHSVKLLAGNSSGKPIALTWQEVIPGHTNLKIVFQPSLNRT